MSRGAISVLTAAGLGLAGAAAILGTLSKAPPGPSGRPRPTGAANTSPPPLLPPLSEEVPDDGWPIQAEVPPTPGEGIEPETDEGSESGLGSPPDPIAWYGIEGIILGTDGVGVVGARLTGSPRYRHCFRVDPHRACSASDGTFVWGVTTLYGSRETLFTVEADGYATRAFALDGSTESGSQEFLRGVEVRLRPGISVSGVVRYPDGEVAGGVDLEAVESPEWTPGRRKEWHEAVGWSTTTDGQGRYQLTGLDPAVVRALFVGDLGSCTGPYPLPEGLEGVGRLDLDLTVPRPREVRVHVVCRGGDSAPLAFLDDRRSGWLAMEGNGASFECRIGWHSLWFCGTNRLGRVRFRVPEYQDPFLLEVDLDTIEWEACREPEDPPPPDDGAPPDDPSPEGE